MLGAPHDLGEPRVLRTAAILAVACLLVASSAASAAAAEVAYDIHVIVAVTGGGSFLGKEEQQALQLAEKTVNKAGGIHGKPLRFVFHDDQSNPQLAVQLATEVVALHPPVMMGSTLVATCNAIAPLVKNGPVTYCFSAGIHPPAGSFVFAAGNSTHDQAAALIRYFRLKGWTRLALITSTDATGQDADRGFDELLAQPGNSDIEVVEHPHFNPTDVSVSAQVERIKAAAPQAVIGWATGSPSATIFRGIAQAGIDVPMGTTGGNMTYAQMRQFAAFLPKALYLPASEWPVGPDGRGVLDPAVAAKQTEFYAAFADTGMKPDEGSILAWDPAAIIVDALRRLPETATAAELHGYLAHLERQAGAAGIYDFVKTPQRGLSLDNVIITRWDPAADRWNQVSQPGGLPLDP
jgi:branched-chain amino acid transport system substrate-binding protein